jgi:hypothetical protein
MTDNRRQVTVFASLLAVNAVLVFLVFALGLSKEFLPTRELPESLLSIPQWLLGLANAAIVVIVYGLLGMAGLWFARKLHMPGIFRHRAGWRRWLVIPMALGGLLGIVLVVADRMFAAAGPPDWTGFPHPTFPLSVFASATAGIGEEIVFRLFVMGLWGFLLNLILRRWGRTDDALWIANVIAAIAFSAGHLPSTMMLLGVSNPAELPAFLLVELFLLNSIVGLVAGERYMKDGLLAAVGVHFWTDIVWHVLWPLAAN